uniref:Inhibitor of growth protein N-terminal histone-binding domain-containing protein n=1 Tax=Meloidogyne javanica TaxID=6303 RepID=A0A915MGE4_MELJA
MKKKCAELRELDFQYQAKMEKLGVDSEQLIEAYPTLTATESEKKNKELEQRYNEARIIADSKVHITEYLQSVLEKYNEKVVKDLTDFKTELEIENPGEVDLIEKDSSLSCDTVHNLQIEGQHQSANSPNTHLNGNDIIDVTPKNKHKTSVPNLRQLGASTSNTEAATITATNIAASKRSRKFSKISDF